MPVYVWGTKKKKPSEDFAPEGVRKTFSWLKKLLRQIDCPCQEKLTRVWGEPPKGGERRCCKWGMSIQQFFLV